MERYGNPTAKARRVALVASLVFMSILAIVLYYLRLSVPQEKVSSYELPLEMVIEVPAPQLTDASTNHNSRSDRTDSHSAAAPIPTTPSKQTDPIAIHHPETGSEFTLEPGEGEEGSSKGRLGADKGHSDSLGPKGSSQRKLVQAGAEPVSERAGFVDVVAMVNSQGLAESYQFVRLTVEDLRQPANVKVRSMRWEERPTQKGLEKISFRIQFSEN